MDNLKKDFDRRKFIKNISLGIAGIGLSQSAFPKNIDDLVNLETSIVPNSNIRSEFMLQPGLSYLNTGSLGPSPTTVFNKIFETTKKLELNPVGNNWGPLGKEADMVREQIANYLNADKDEIILTRNTTEGINLIANGLKLKAGDEIITTTDEHYGGVVGWEFLERHHGVIVKKIDFPKEDIDTDQVLSLVKKQLSPKTKVCSFMDVSTVTGMRLPIEEIAAILSTRDILLVCDGAQSTGMVKVDVKKMNVDIFAGSGHKWMLGPKETGFLYLRKGIQDRIESVQLETGFKLYNHNTGTRNVANFIGLGEAIRFQDSLGGIKKIEQHNIALGKYLRAQLKNIKSFKLITPEEDQLLSGISSVIVKDGNVKELHTKLNENNIVVKKLGKIDVMRFSTHIFNTEEELNHLVKVLHSLVK